MGVHVHETHKTIVIWEMAQKWLPCLDSHIPGPKWISGWSWCAQTLCGRSSFACFGVSSWGAGIWFGDDGLVTETGGCHLCALSPFFHAPECQYLPERSFHTCLVPQLLWLPPGTPLRCLPLVASGAYVCGPIGLYILAYLKSCCLQVCLPNNLNLGTDWDPPLCNTDRS